VHFTVVVYFYHYRGTVTKRYLVWYFYHCILLW